MMEAQTGLALAIVAILLCKHMIFDFVLQTRYQLDHKQLYGHPGGLLHAGLHALGTLPAIVIARPSLIVAVAVLVGEFVVHYHVDWGKEQLLRRSGWTRDGARYWAVFGADQLIHNLGYLVMTAVLVSR
ncbi:MAG TPA: DUF3307 domain-containing protein [Caulobacteraceae bacterium]